MLWISAKEIAALLESVVIAMPEASVAAYLGRRINLHKTGKQTE
jgi:hypothetical protein